LKDPRKEINLPRKNLPEAGSPMGLVLEKKKNGQFGKKCDSSKPFQIKGRCFKYCRNGEMKTRDTADGQSFELTGLCGCLEGTDQELAQDKSCGMSPLFGSALLETSKQ
jgi:hypothetical protein